MEEKKLRQKIKELLLQLGITPDLGGFACLVEAILLWIQIDVTQKPRISKEIYPVVGEKLGITPSNVERRIRHCCESLGKHVSMLRVVEILGVAPDAKSYCYTNSQFIALCALKIGGAE